MATSPRAVAFREDVERFVHPRSSPVGLKLLARVVSEPGLQFVWLGRVQIALEQRGRKWAARFAHLLNLRLTGGELGHGCQVGGGLVVKHPLGVVIGGGSVIGTNCTILHNVVLGDRELQGSLDAVNPNPTLGDNCLIGTAAVILGPIVVGDGARVGAGAVVIHDVPAGVTVVGVPARPVQRGSGAA